MSECLVPTTAATPARRDGPSPRETELLEAAYRYAVEQGLADLSLRPLAQAIGSSPRVLLYLFDSKDGLIRALLTRARTDELAMLDRLRNQTTSPNLATTGRRLWEWLSASDHRGVLALWVEAYARSLVDLDGPWAGFAAQTVGDWLDLLSEAQPARSRHTRAALAARTAVLAVLRGAMLDLLATGDLERTTRAVERQLAALTD
jgi:AcrR family transcriptional regulator